ncbi:MAG: hypothetical protein V7638_3126 [Acidobacteriota bacterium]
MRPPKTRYSLLVLCLLVLCVVTLVYSRMMTRIPRGEWGGIHISMNVGERSATIEYDCAHGEIQGPLATDGEGKFQLQGTFTPERGGPVRADESQRAQPATYSGEVKGNTMTLNLKVGDSDETETFTLEKGKAARLVKCK